jgi:hypothetical protein
VAAVIYRITFPNGKIYVGKDETDTITYFGSPNATLVASDFTDEERNSFSVTRDILWRSETASRREVNQKEMEFILRLRSNDPEIGYNRWPRFRPDNESLQKSPSGRHG